MGILFYYRNVNISSHDNIFLLAIQREKCGKNGKKVAALEIFEIWNVEQ